MNITIIHPSFPGQYYYLAPYLARNPENKVVFLSQENNTGADLPGVQLGIYKEPNKAAPDTHHYLKTAANAVLEGQQVIRALHNLKDKGFTPDIIIGHAGWGSLLYTKEVLPKVPTMGYFEWYYHPRGTDNYFWPGEEPETDTALAIQTKNMHHLLALESCDMGITPTQWQKQQFPVRYHDFIRLQHEGTDTKFCCPPEGNRKPPLSLQNGACSLPEGTEIISYVSRGFEALRGFDKFMDAIRIVLARRPKCHVVLAGQDRICYGKDLPDGKTYKGIEEEKGGYDKERVHFVGSLNRTDYKNLLQASSCHVYLTRPFVLSWSMLEAMSFGLPLVASATPPCMEVVTDRENGLLAEFRSPKHIADKIEEILTDRELAQRLGKNARETILERFELGKALRNYEDLIYELVRP